MTLLDRQIFATCKCNFYSINNQVIYSVGSLMIHDFWIRVLASCGPGASIRCLELEIGILSNLSQLFISKKSAA